MMNINWNDLATNSGALAFVLVLIQFTKSLPFIAQIPTQVWSFILSLLALFSAKYFTRGFNLSDIGLIFFNAILVSLEANGGYEAIKRIFPTSIN
jgi:hypothetical protein